jgi:hypothetical protein
VVVVVVVVVVAATPNYLRQASQNLGKYIPEYAVVLSALLSQVCVVLVGGPRGDRRCISGHNSAL